MKKVVPPFRGTRGHTSWLDPYRAWLPVVGLLVVVVALCLLALPQQRGPRPPPFVADNRPTGLKTRSEQDQDTPPHQSRGSVPLTLLQGPDGKPKGLCLDGSSPSYSYSRGTGHGSDSWLVFLEGGAWCGDEKRCLQRRGTRYGSSKLHKKRGRLRGPLSNNPKHNPDFYNWNRVFVYYCDGASFAGTVSEPVGETADELLYLQGQLIWESVMEELLLRGMANASQALLAGASAGGLACLLHCDQFAALFQPTTTVKCLSDSGFFLDPESSDGRHWMRTLFQHVTQFQKPRLDPACLAERPDADSWQCLFPVHLARHISTPLFLLNSAYDTWQIKHSLVPSKSPDADSWNTNCLSRGLTCLPTQLDTLQEFRQMLLTSIQPLLERESTGIFVDSCFVHSQSLKHWNGPVVNNKTIRDVVGDWYFERGGSMREIDCPFPCNPTCMGNTPRQKGK